MEIKKRSLEKSENYWQRCIPLIPAGTQTLSKGPTQFVDGVAPKYLLRGKGCHVWDVDGNEYIDYGMGCRSVFLGYHYPAVDKAIVRQLKDGINFTMMHPLEVELAELLKKTIPCAEMTRYGKNGSDVTSAAVRAARAHTKRDKVAICGYHGWQDWYAATTERNAGIPNAVKDLSLTFKYNDIDSLRKLFAENPNQIAAVIMEPVGITPPKEGFLEEVKEIAHKEGAVLIFDEIITGFRWSLGGAQEYFKVTPDMATFGKAMANGMPLSTVVGKAEIMKEFENVFFSFTFGGEALSLAAAVASINEIKAKNVIPFIWKQGGKLQKAYNKIANENGIQKYTQCVGYPPSTAVTFKDSNGKDSYEMKSLVQQEMIKRGILWPAIHSMSYSHKNRDVKTTVDAFGDSLQVLKKALEEGNIAKYLEGKPVQPVFRPTN